VGRCVDPPTQSKAPICGSGAYWHPFRGHLFRPT
jgi:hypothetical protein